MPQLNWKCDRCGTAILSKGGYISIRAFEEQERELIVDDPSVSYVFCVPCTNYWANKLKERSQKAGK